MNEHPVILLAEDNEDHVFIFRRAIHQAGITTPLHVVGDGEQVIKYLQATGRYRNRSEYPLPDLLLLDLKMPRKDGFEVLKWIREQPSLSTLRVVVLTTSDRIQDVNEAYRLGANSFLVKPLEFAELRNMLTALHEYWVTLSKMPEISRSFPAEYNRDFQGPAEDVTR
jgi:CheY-like chemotaxis protein